MNRILSHIESRNSLLSNDLISLKSELQNCFNHNVLKAGVLQPGYFSYFYPILEKYRNMKVIQKFMVTEEEYSDGGTLYKIPVIDVAIDSHLNSRIFLSPISR